MYLKCDGVILVFFKREAPSKNTFSSNSESFLEKNMANMVNLSLGNSSHKRKLVVCQHYK